MCVSHIYIYIRFTYIKHVYIYIHLLRLLRLLWLLWLLWLLSFLLLWFFLLLLYYIKILIHNCIYIYMCVLLYINIQYISVCTPSSTHRQPGETGETGETPAASPVVYPPPVELSRDPPGRSSVASTLWHSAAGLPGGPGDQGPGTGKWPRNGMERDDSCWFCIHDTSRSRP